jgi:hypothetical protein
MHKKCKVQIVHPFVSTRLTCDIMNRKQYHQWACSHLLSAPGGSTKCTLLPIRWNGCCRGDVAISSMSCRPRVMNSSQIARLVSFYFGKCIWARMGVRCSRCRIQKKQLPYYCDSLVLGHKQNDRLSLVVSLKTIRSRTIRTRLDFDSLVSNP